ncbi:hypothetical protein SERLADRAFT_433779 [Serpula lacrymans var. lacrymans S7.9]|uniref:Uncharacterized protein n=1 Tax=Serpula lacrymans var. lacrymans (strain S7.9) TaxID=578457 RepID=F8NJC3_SERL9|nr:uncharacterized protein SERLADRAFT_433779 [Serpula lacrymans var. lacrymans S7.9]EGO29821.1 hypothetical protein SERLADRAFT_433779 [Serpula lacrymans var. lacrymans S7.9]
MSANSPLEKPTEPELEVASSKGSKKCRLPAGDFDILPPPKKNMKKLFTSAFIERSKEVNVYFARKRLSLARATRATLTSAEHTAKC